MPPRTPPPPTFWEEYKENIRGPALIFLSDSTIIVMALAVNLVIFLFSKSVQTIVEEAWFIHNLKRIDLLSTLINVVILLFNSTGKIVVMALKEYKREGTV